MKNLKKGLAVAMSLAMIATVVPATKVDATNYCTLDQNKAYDKVLGALEDAGLEIDTMKLTDLVDDKDDDDESNDVDVEAFLTTNATAISDYAGCNIRPSDEVADKLVDFITGVKANETTITDLETKMILDGDIKIDGTTANADGAWIDEIPSGDYDDAKTLYATLTSDDFAAYLANVSEEHANAYNAYFAEFETVLDEYRSDNFDDVVDAYVTELKKVALATGFTVDQFMTAKGKVEYTKLASVVKAVDKIKDNDIAALKAIAKYEDMEVEDDVAEIMDELDAAIEGMEEVKDLMNTRNAVTVAYNKIAGRAEVKALLANNPSAGDDFSDLINAVSTDKLEAIADYYNEVTSMFYELTVKERANGTYTASLSATDLVDYLSTTDADKIKAVFNALATVVDKDEEETYLDIVINKADDITKALKAITTDIKGITVKNLNSANAAKVVAAKEAVELLTDNKGSLTSSQVKTLNTAAKNIDVLYTYMLFNGIVAETNNGWVDLGNGNWDYYQDSKPVTKWVAAGSDWYFVQEGHMLRNSWVAKDAAGAVWYYVDNAGKMVSNTTVGGYVINANGEWHK